MRLKRGMRRSYTWRAVNPFHLSFLPLRFEELLLFEVYGHLGDEVGLNQLVTSVEAAVQHWQLPYFLTIFHRGYGAFYTTQAAWVEAEAAFKQALAATRGQAFWYQDARTWLDYGRMFAQRGQPGDVELAQEFLNEAQNMFAAFDAHALAEKAWIEVTRLAQ